jgi:hypothetical protein
MNADGRRSLSPSIRIKQMNDDILARIERITAELGQVAHDLGHLDIRTLSVADKMAVLRLQRVAHDSALSFQNAKPR